jgi:hypothetical protein
LAAYDDYMLGKESIWKLLHSELAVHLNGSSARECNAKGACVDVHAETSSSAATARETVRLWRYARMQIALKA